MEEAIYALVDPRDNLEFYVGRTQDIYQRFIQHLRCDGKNDAKNARIRELRYLHLIPIMRTLEVVKDDTALAAQREAYWIRHLKYLGIVLTNDIVYSSNGEEVQEFNVNGRSKQHKTKSDPVRKIERILRRNPKTKADDLAVKAGISISYAQKIRARFMKDHLREA